MQPAETDPAVFEAGALLGGRFRIVRAVGRGGMGVVYEAFDEKLDRRVALKCARPGHHDRLPPEARAAREVSHYNVCKVHELHVLSTPLGEMECLSMEFIEGETLSTRVQRQGRIPAGEAREIALQICAGLAQAHKQAVVHGDLKTGNVILTRSRQGSLRAVITDFGLAKMTDTAETEPHAGGGTYNYMAPEQFLGEPATVASDVYALGVLFHVMLTGNSPAWVRPRPVAEPPQPWSGGSLASTATLGHAIAEADWQRKPAELPAPWKRVVARCLKARPQSRFGSAEAVVNALQPHRRLLKWTAALAAACVLVIAGAQWRNQPPSTPVRLAVLPFSAQGERIENAAGIGLEVADRLSGVRRNFTVVSPREAESNQANTAEKAKSILGATHVLQTALRLSGGQVLATASLFDMQSGRSMQRLEGAYPAGDAAGLAKALVATVAVAFHLPSSAPKETVAPAAYPYYVQGIDLLRRDSLNNADTALPLFSKAAELDPRSALPYAWLAEAQMAKFRKGDGHEWLDAAQATVTKAKSINADSVPVLSISGEAEQQHGRYEQAIREFSRATELEPENSDVWQRLALVYERTNRIEEAAATYRKAIQAQPNYYRPYIHFGNFYLNRGQYDHAEEQYRHVTQLAPELPSGHMNLGLALMQEGRFPEAEAQLLEALRLRTSRDLLINLGALYYQEHRFREASEYFERSLSSGTPSAMLYRNLGDAYRHLGRTKNASDAYHQAKTFAEEEVARNPRLAASHALLGLIAAFLRDRRQSEYEMAQALAMDAENRAVIRNAAIAYESLGQRAKTLAALRHAPRRLLEELSRQPDVPELKKDSDFQRLLGQKTLE